MFVNKRTLSIFQLKKQAKKMNIEDNLSPLFFGQQQSYHKSFHKKYHQNEKTTPFTAHNNQKRYNQQFVQQPPFQASSFFLTPVCPKNNRYDILIQSAKSYATQGIYQKLNFKKDEQIQNYEFLQEYQQLQANQNAPKSCKRNTKSLKNLSQSVYLIMTKLRKATYKLVAQMLIADNIIIGQQFNKDKDEQTLKRRVYDALNVLVAAGILQKKGKEISCSHAFPFGHKSKYGYQNEKQIEEKGKMEVNLHKKIEELGQKRKILDKLKQKKQNISRFIYRNQSQQPQEEKILSFPLISTIIESQKMQLIESFENHVIFRFGYRPYLYGDVDLMLRIIEKPPVKLQTEVENIYNVLSEVEEIQFELGIGKTRCLAQADNCVKFQAKLHS